MESYIKHTSAGTSFVGPDATALFAAITVKHALKLYLATNGRVKASRMYTLTNMLNFVTNLSQRKYKRGEAREALEFLEIWVKEMRGALPEVSDA